MLTLGVTTVECKSGYGLEPDAELKLLRVYRQLADRTAGAHGADVSRRARRASGVPRINRAGYVDLLVDRMIPAMAQEKLAACCDVFVEESAFSVAEARRILRAGQKSGLSAKLHADQLSEGGGAELAAELGRPVRRSSGAHLGAGHRGHGCGGSGGGEPSASPRCIWASPRCPLAG